MAAAPTPLAPQDASKAFRRACGITLVAVLFLVGIAVFVPFTGQNLEKTGPSFLFFWMQDVRIVPLVALTLLVAPLLTSRQVEVAGPRVWTMGGLLPVSLALVLGLVGWAGHGLIFDGYDLTRDEQMANFDAYAFARGRLTWPITQTWRPLAEALNQLFILPVGAHEAWISAYLPVNAAFRAATGLIADAALTGPAFVVAGALALWRIALRLWPDAPSTQWVVLLLYAGSAQILVTSMTAYAMSAHLGLDLVWLALFLRGGTASHAGAAGIGFLATGLHQPLFHPLFVLPFLDLLRQERRWRLLTFYVVAYGAIGLFWLAWPLWISGAARHTNDGVGYLDRLMQVLHAFDLETIALMALNLLRFVTWQHLLLAPLLVVGLSAVRREPLVRALAIGLALPVVVVAIILPLQGHGWGYRYLHGVLGNAFLIAGYGWHRLTTGGLGLRRPFAWASVATFLVVVPACALVAHLWVEPYARVAGALSASKADIVIVENAAVPWGRDLVLNRPDLSNRPVRLLGSALRPQDMSRVCGNGSIAFFAGPKLQPIRRMFALAEAPVDAKTIALETAAQAAGCTIVVPSPPKSP